MTEFQYEGPISASKSLFNRALVIQSFFPNFKVEGESRCDDVVKMKQALSDFKNQSEIDCGEAGTVLRFMAFRVSREKGVFRLKGTPRLFQRPQRELLSVLSQLSVQAELSANELVIRSQGWKPPSVVVQIHRKESSQFATGLLMSAWGLEFPLELELFPWDMKDSYWDMSLHFAAHVGMQIISQDERGHYLVPAHQRNSVDEYQVETDYSSVFPIAVLAALGGNVSFTKINQFSFQPDYFFIEIFKDLGIPICWDEGKLLIKKVSHIRPVDLNIKNVPDLFPVLSVLCAFAQGQSRLYGAPRLAYKESHRIKKTSDLLTFMGIRNEVLDDGLVIHGQGMDIKQNGFEFDPDQDHRMVMAVGILMRLGWRIRLKTPMVVKKSFPEFWEILQMAPNEEKT